MSKQLIHIELGMKFLRPLDVLILTEFIIIQRVRLCGIRLFASNEVLKHLKDIGLVSFIDRNTEQSETISGIVSQTAMPLRRVEREKMGEYINGTRTFMQSMCAGRDLDMLDLCLSELINNVYDHSGSPIDAYVFCQFYPKSNTIEVAVSDLGKGIPNAVNEFMGENGLSVMESIDCLKWAVKENHTTQSFPQNKGKGLDNVKSFAKANAGSWGLLSGDAYLTGYPSGNKYQSNPIEGFIGTVAWSEIRIDNLPDKDSVVDDGWSI